MTKIMISALGFDYEEDVELDYSIAAPAQVAQMMIANRVDLAVLPEPFVTMVRNSNSKVIPLIDIQALWSALTGTDNYPMTVVVVSDAFVAKNSKSLPIVMDAIKDSIAWVNENPKKLELLLNKRG